MMQDSLDIEDAGALTEYLRRTGGIGADERPAVRVLAGGVSNRTVLVRRGNGEAWVIKQALAKLRVGLDWFSDPGRIHREAAGIRWLTRLLPAGAITPLVFEDREHHLLAMTAVPEPHENWKTVLLAGRIDARHVDQFGRMLGLMHRGGHERRAELEAEFADRSFFESLRLEPYYQYTAGKVPESRAFLTDLMAATRERRETLVHGDYSPKNILIHDNRLVLLDHEVIHFGDPAFDLGFAMTHLLSKAHHLPGRRAAFADAVRRFWHAYRETLGGVPWTDNLEAMAVRHTLGCLLARVAGRSPLEYLGVAERALQQRAVVQLMRCAPLTVAGLAERFLEQIERAEAG